MFYLIKNDAVVMTGSSTGYLKKYAKEKGITGYTLGEDIMSKYISRITYIDGDCIYGDTTFWSGPIADAMSKDVNSCGLHTVLDFMGNSVDYNRFVLEYGVNSMRAESIDGTAGEIDYNITIGNEFISLFREECIRTDFKGITPLEIGIKLANIIPLLQSGCFRETCALLNRMERDPFLTDERIAKYCEMLQAADEITYAS